MLEVFTLKQHLDSTRKELSQALYQHDAACRVIARLLRERDEARAMLISGQVQGSVATVAPHASSDAHNTSVGAGAGAGAGASSMDVEKTAAPTTPWKQTHAIWDDCIAGISAACVALQSARKQRPKKIPAEVRASEAMAAMQKTVSASPHKASPAGIACMAFQPGAHEGASILTGGMDTDIHLTSHTTGKGVCKIAKAHEKRVSCVAFHADLDRGMFLSGSSDHAVKLWAPSVSEGRKDYSQYSAVSTFQVHTGNVAAVCAHPFSRLACSFSADGTVACLELERQVVAMHISEQRPCPYEYLCGGVHPDAVMFAGGTNTGALKVWDMRQAELAVSLTDHSANGVTAVAFSNNGYFVCTGDAEGDLRLWDLRKISCLHSQKVGTKAIGCISIDDFGFYAAVGGCGDGSAVQLWNIKNWERMASPSLESAHSKAVTGVAWGANASLLVTASMDRTLKVHA
jgi:pre-mRNA-processing factor 19